MTDQDVTDPRRDARQGRWAMAMGIFSAFSLLMCAAFAEQAARKLGGPSAMVLWGLAGLGGICVVLLYLGSDLNQIRRRTYVWIAVVLAALMTFLNAWICLFIYNSAKGGVIDPAHPEFVIPPTPSDQVIMSFAIFGAILILALLCLWRLVANAGPGNESP